MQTYFMEYDCVKNQVLPSLKHEFIKVTDVMLNQDGGAGASESNIMCINPDFYTGFDNATLNEIDKSNEFLIIMLRGAELQKPSFSTVELMSRAMLIITDDSIPLAESIEAMIADFKSQKQNNFMHALHKVNRNWMSDRSFIQMS